MNELKFKPSLSCADPVRIVQGSVVRYVPCRKCIPCLNNRGLELSMRVNNECKAHKYSLFFTLTYDNEHIPMLEKIGRYQHKFDRTNEYFYFDKEDLAGVEPPIKHEVIGFGVCYKKDIQDFIKRLRINIQRKIDKNERIRYFICSEYGPNTTRPHYHGILWTENLTVAEYIKNRLHESWKMCDKKRIDVQYIQGNAANYVAKYVACSNRLPNALKSKDFRPFYLASRNPAVGYFGSDEMEVHDLFYNGVVKNLQYDDKEKTFVDRLYSLPFLVHHFPKCQGFNKSDVFGKLRLVEKYARKKFTKSKEQLGYSLDVRYNGDTFCYQDARFVKRVLELTKPFKYPERDSNGVLTGRIRTATLSIDEVVEKYVNLYKRFEYELLADNLNYIQEFTHNITDSHKRKLLLLTNYPEIYKELPEYLSKLEFHTKYHCLYSLGIEYQDLYRSKFPHGTLRTDVMQFFSDNPYYQTFYNNEVTKHRKSLATKKYNDIYTDLNR